MDALFPLCSVASSRHPLFHHSREGRPRLPGQAFALRREPTGQDDGSSLQRRRMRGDQGKMVEEGMIVLRKRIHETKMFEKNYEPPSEWMEWEKQYYSSYDSMICDVMGLLQSWLMESRPSMVLGAVALIIVSLSTTSALAIYHLLRMATAILSGMHSI